VNRWDYGSARMQSDIYDASVARGEQPPYQRARQRYGRITIANTAAAGIGSTPCAIDQACRAVAEDRAYDSLNVF
jgi:spermidine dehydrogenase